MKLSHIVIVAAALGLTAGAFAGHRLCVSQSNNGNCSWDNSTGAVSVETHGMATLTPAQASAVARTVNKGPVDFSGAKFSKPFTANELKNLRASCPNAGCIVEKGQVPAGAHLPDAQN